MLDKHSTTELHPSPEASFTFFKFLLIWLIDLRQSSMAQAGLKLMLFFKLLSTGITDIHSTKLAYHNVLITVAL